MLRLIFLSFQTAFSYILFTVFTFMSVNESITNQLGFIEIFKVATMPNAGECLWLIFPSLVQWMVLIALCVSGWVAYTIYLISCIVKRHDNGNYDDWRLKEYAYPFVRRLLRPILPQRLPASSSVFNRILRMPWLREAVKTSRVTDIQQQNIGMAQRRQSGWQTTKAWFGRKAKQVALFIVQVLKDGTMLFLQI
jgi:hypothetical protein